MLFVNIFKLLKLKWTHKIDFGFPNNLSKLFKVKISNWGQYHGQHASNSHVKLSSFTHDNHRIWIHV